MNKLCKSIKLKMKVQEKVFYCSQKKKKKKIYQNFFTIKKVWAISRIITVKMIYLKLKKARLF